MTARQLIIRLLLLALVCPAALALLCAVLADVRAERKHAV